MRLSDHKYEALNERLQIFLNRFTCAGSCAFNDFWRAYAAVEQLSPGDFVLRGQLHHVLKARGMLRHGGQTVEGALHSGMLYPFLHPRT